MNRRKKLLKNVVIATSLASTLMITSIANKSISFADTIKSVNASALNVRSGAGTNYKKIGTLHKGNKVTVISTSNGWSKIKFDGKTAYVSSKYLSNASNNSSQSSSTKIVNTSSLNVRNGAGTNYKKIGSLSKGTKVNVISESKGWSKINYNKGTGYVSSKYLSNAPSNNNSNDNSQSSSTKVVNTSSLNVRSGAGTNYKKVGTLYKDSKVIVISTSNGWSKIKFDGKNAYVSSKYLSNVPSGNSSILNVPFINQYPNLPLGCEATSLAQILNYKGVSVTKTKIADEMLKSPNKNPNLGFVGSPYRNEKGIFQTIYPKALESTAKKYRPNSEDITGASVDTLEKELKKGNPSVIWVSRNFSNPEMGYWYEGTKDQMWVNKNLHVVAVTGVDSNYFYITDPAQGKYKVSKSKFKDVYYTVGKKALVVR